MKQSENRPGQPTQSLLSLPRRLAHRYRETAAQRPDEDINMRVLTAFLATFCTVRIITHGIRNHWLPLGNIVLGGGEKKQDGEPLHIHHMVWGILALTACGYAALLQTELSWRRRLAPLYGAGVALTYDEFALWLHLEDDYWTKQGRASVDAVVLLSALFGLASASPLFWQRALNEVTHTAVPGAPGEARMGIRRCPGELPRTKGETPDA
ncbi:MAG TPA: hypothetical protein VNF75_06920 [Candidatus Dormibacteraeota bacterium]|nr:hypothetical protein [Candidatus Dormibacteraeota bacterium]